MFMKRTSFIKGKPMYIYKRRRYVYQPEKTTVRVMKYDEEDNTTYVYCVKTTLIPEFIITSMLVLLTIFNLLLNMRPEVIYYNTEVIYHNELLYLNLKSEDTNSYLINYSLYDLNKNAVSGGILYPGDLVTTIKMKEPEEYYILNFKYNTLLGEKNKTVYITVLNKDAKSVNGVDEHE